MSEQLHTDPELEKAAIAAMLAFCHDIRQITPWPDVPETFRVTFRQIADAVRMTIEPGIVRRVLAHRPDSVWQERPGEISWRCKCGHVTKHEQLHPGLETILYACPQAEVHADA